MDTMKTLILSNEYPPYNYGGAGVHVEYLSRELAKLIQVEVRCFGDQHVTEGNLTVRGFELDSSHYGCPKSLVSGFGAIQRGLDFNSCGIDATHVHCHTWYTHMAGIVAKLNYGIPLIITTHSLEPLRPWKREQLGGGYDFSLWVERTAIEMADAIIAVSQGTKTISLNTSPFPKRKFPSSIMALISRNIKNRHQPTRFTAMGLIPPYRMSCLLGESPDKKGSYILCKPSNT